MKTAVAVTLMLIATLAMAQAEDVEYTKQVLEEPATFEVWDIHGNILQAGNLPKSIDLNEIPNAWYLYINAGKSTQVFKNDLFYIGVEWPTDRYNCLFFNEETWRSEGRAPWFIRSDYSQKVSWLYPAGSKIKF